MKNYKSIVYNKKHLAGSTGATVEIYDKTKTVVARLEGLKKAYDLCLSPNGELLCVRSANGYFVIFSIASLAEIGKVEIDKKYNSVDGGMLFLHDSTRLYNIEVQEADENMACTVAVYSMEDLTLTKRASLPKKTYINDFEYDSADGNYYVIGYVRGEDGYRFIAKFSDGEIVSPVKITKSEHELYAQLKCLENRGHNSGKFTGNAESFLDRGFSLAKLYKYRKENEI
ncbi:MAG: hypothetical protein E7647_04635 [Ruminococcaceae bacterium]|nr:hypothetical protein [Oscillospiraceae bacterium]